MNEQLTKILPYLQGIQLYVQPDVDGVVLPSSRNLAQYATGQLVHVVLETVFYHEPDENDENDDGMTFHRMMTTHTGSNMSKRLFMYENDRSRSSLWNAYAGIWRDRAANHVAPIQPNIGYNHRSFTFPRYYARNLPTDIPLIEVLANGEYPITVSGDNGVNMIPYHSTWTLEDLCGKDVFDRMWANHNREYPLRLSLHVFVTKPNLSFDPVRFFEMLPTVQMSGENIARAMYNWKSKSYGGNHNDWLAVPIPRLNIPEVAYEPDDLREFAKSILRKEKSVYSSFKKDTVRSRN